MRAVGFVIKPRVLPRLHAGWRSTLACGLVFFVGRLVIFRITPQGACSGRSGCGYGFGFGIIFIGKSFLVAPEGDDIIITPGTVVSLLSQSPAGSARSLQRTVVTTVGVVATVRLILVPVDPRLGLGVVEGELDGDSFPIVALVDLDAILL